MELAAVLAAWDQWLREHAPRTHAQLLPGAEVAETIPELAAVWRWHAGQRPEPPPPTKPKAKPVLLPALAISDALFSVLSPDDAATHKATLDRRLASGGFDTPEYTTKHAWHPRWYPFAVAGNKTTILVIDLEGCFAGGVPGQLVEVDTRRALERTLYAPSLHAALEHQLAMAEQGGLTIDPKTGALKLNTRTWRGIAGYPKRKNIDKTARPSSRSASDKLLDLVKERMSRSEVEAAIAAGAALEVRDASGRAPIHLAAQAATTGPLEALLAAGAAVDLPDATGRTALAIAVELVRARDAVAMIQLLVAHGASPDRADADGQTPRTRAVNRWDVASRAEVVGALGA